MTREEEIKSRATRYGVKYVELDGTLANLAEGDMAYILARNEELQRRMWKLEKVAERSRAMVDLFIEKVETGAARSKKTYEDALAVREELMGLDAEESDNETDNS